MSTYGNWLRSNKVTPAAGFWFDCLRCGAPIAHELVEKKIRSGMIGLFQDTFVSTTCKRCESIYTSKMIEEIYRLGKQQPCSIFDCPACKERNVILSRVKENQIPIIGINSEEEAPTPTFLGTLTSGHWHNPKFHICVGCKRPIKMLDYKYCFSSLQVKLEV